MRKEIFQVNFITKEPSLMIDKSDILEIVKNKDHLLIITRGYSLNFMIPYDIISSYATISKGS